MDVEEGIEVLSFECFGWIARASFGIRGGRVIYLLHDVCFVVVSSK